MCLTLAVAGAVYAHAHVTGHPHAASILIGLSVVLMELVSLLAVGLGLGGLFQKDRRKLFAWLGFGIAAFTVLSTGGLIILGVFSS